MAEFYLSDIVVGLGGHVKDTIGDLERSVSKPASLNQAGPGTITFCNRVGEQLVSMVTSSRATAIICGPLLEHHNDVSSTLIVVEQPRRAFMDMMHRFFPEQRPVGIHPTAIIDPSVSIADGVYVGPHVSIGVDCSVGEGTVIHPNVAIYPRTRIGANVTVHANTVIGATGFGYERDASGELVAFPHVGGVVIEDHVEIGSNTSIDRGTLGDTIIKAGAKIDNLVHVAHNVVVGQDVCLIALAMVGGSSRVGARSWISPSASIRDGLEIGEDATVGLGAVVVKNVESGSIVMGAPARLAGRFKAQLKVIDGLIGDSDE